MKKIIYFLIFGCFLFLGINCSEDESVYSGNHVTIEGEKGTWKIIVNGKPFNLKGAGVSQAFGRDGKVDYLKLAKEMGSNCVRTWGVDQGSEEYLDKAYEYGLFVDAGIWTEWVDEKKTCSYIENEVCKNKLRKKTLDYVKKNMNHPAILFWNIGNETISFTKDENERVAFAKFLEELVKDVKSIDPHHPVIYTSAYTTALDYIVKYVPGLDILGVNIYGGFDYMHKQVSSILNIPYIITEYGPLGPWDRKKDINGRSSEATDRSKTHNYKMLFRAINSHKGYSLGGFVFLLGDTTQNSSTWWNLTYQQYKKLPYFAIKEFFTGQKFTQKIPHVNYLTFSKRKNLKPSEIFTVEVGIATNSLPNIKYHYFASTDLDHSLEEYPNAEIPVEINGSGPVVEIKAPTKPGIYRIYALVTDANNNASTLSKTISVVSKEKE